VTKEWESLFPTVHAFKYPRALSYHNPLILASQRKIGNIIREFRFELCWLKNSELMEKVREIWLSPTRDNIALNKMLFKLKKVKKFLKGWGFNKAKKNKKRKKETGDDLRYLEEYEKQDALSVEQIRKRCQLKSELFMILEEEELFWFRRCHEN
jgi:tRNA nucleotidyltransferase/poly(A) polymerase